jgi:phosphonoacetate hydrolase
MVALHPQGEVAVSTRQRVVVGILDGLDPAYLDGGHTPALRRMARDGVHRTVEAVFPTVTNVNNVSVCCGAWPDEHGIAGNSYFDEASGGPAYMNAADLIRAETLFERAARQGVSSAVLTCKRKTLELFRRGVGLSMAAEDPPHAWVERLGSPGSIYSFEINHWIWRAAIDLLDTRPDLGLVYVHTTDYPMHRWGPEAVQTREHLSRLDALIGEACQVAPEAAFLLTADHGMNQKTRCWDLRRVLERHGVPPRFVLSPERDYYPAHHRDFTGCAFVWLQDPADLERSREALVALAGVEEVLEGWDAAVRFRLPAKRIGDLVVLGDRETMFGDLANGDQEVLRGYRAHGSLHERAVPLWMYRLDAIDMPGEPRHNLDLTRTLFR